MKTLWGSLFCFFARLALSLRYCIKVKGLKSIDSKGVLFLANHPAEIDPVILTAILWPRFRIHPVAIDYLFHASFVSRLMHAIGAISVPNFENASNSYKKKLIEKSYKQILALLESGENVLMYPAGGIKKQEEEILGGTSGTHTLLQRAPHIKIALVRTTGLWGSSFSKAISGKTPALAPTFLHGFHVILKNLIFFTPRRKILVEIEPAHSDFPFRGERLEINRFLEQWYNANGKESLKLIPYLFWRRKIPIIETRTHKTFVSSDAIAPAIRESVLQEIRKMVPQIDPSKVTADADLALDLGMDSLDTSQLAAFLKESFGVAGVHPVDLTTVQDVCAFAAKLKMAEEEKSRDKTSYWSEEKYRQDPELPDVETITEAFFETARKRSSLFACADEQSGALTYKKAALAVILLAKQIEKLPGAHVGVMLPASSAVMLIILATQLAGKVPVMINWTLGARHLEYIQKTAQIETTISSEKFLNRMEHCDLNGIDDNLTLVEDLRNNITLLDKLKALFLLQFSSKIGLKIKKENPAVILFTSGTESQPKGVPLSHNNILSNLESAMKSIHFSASDVLLAALPPFHSFGFSVTGLFPLITGMKVAFTPNPTDGKAIANAIERAGATLLCLAPTFLKTFLRVAKSEQIKTLRTVVSGAEKMGEDILNKMKELNPQTRVIEGYGITECSPILTLNRPEDIPRGVGKPLPGVEIIIVDPETHQQVAQGENGLILARGPNVFAGYLGGLADPFVILNGIKWYNTGDLGSLDSHGALILSGRLKRFVKIGGEMISLATLEEILMHAALEQGWSCEGEAPLLATCAIEESGRKTEIYLFTVFNLDLGQANQILKQAGLNNLARLTGVYILPFIPLLSTGKVDYQELKRRIHER